MNNNNNNDKKNNNDKYEIDYLSEEFIVEKKNGIDEEIQTEEIKDEPYKNNNIKKYTLNQKNKNSGTIYKHTKVEDSKPTYYTKNDEDKKKNERVYDKYNEVEVNRNNEKDNIIDDNETIEDNNKKKNKVSFGVKNDSNDIDEQYKREESMSRAMRRINNRRKLDKMNEDKNKFRKSKKITGMAEKLQDKLKDDDRKLFVDLEYEKNRAEEEEQEEEEYYDN